MPRLLVGVVCAALLSVPARPSAEPGRLDLDATLDSLRLGLDPVLRLRLGGRVSFSGVWGERHLEASADLTEAPGGLARSWLAGLAGRGRLEFSGGAIASEALFQAVAGGIVATIPGISRIRTPREGPPALLERITASFRIFSAGLRSEDLEIVTSDYHVVGRGVLAPDGSLDFDIRVRFNSLGLARIRRLTFLDELPTPPRALPTVPVDVSGSVGKPVFKPDLSEISLATLGWLPGMAGRLTEEAYDAGRDAVHGAGTLFDRLHPPAPAPDP